jgi:D-sedoheptulose 7-phosphate isomerase
MSAEALKTLYPFLHGGAQDPAMLDAVMARTVAARADELARAQARFFADQTPALIAAARAVAAVYRGGGRLYTMGNGGSSCDAAHLAVEFAHPVTAGRPALPAVSLCADTALISALGNDLGFEHVFVRQLSAQARAGDGLVGFSTSGGSANLIAAFAKGRAMGLTTVGFSGGDGGAMASPGLLDHCLVAPTASIHHVQECHVAAYHLLWDLVHTLLADDRGAAA